MPRFKAIVFDLDGTLVDSVGSITAALNQLLKDEGLPAVRPDDVKDMVGDGAMKLLERGFAAAGRPVGADDLPGLFQRYVPLLTRMPPLASDLYPGVVDTLRRFEMDGVALGICTNKPYRPAVEAVRAMGLSGLFGAVVGGDSLPERKPAAAPLLAAIDRLGARPKDAVMVGDNGNDVGTARNAGIPCVVVSYGYPRMPVDRLQADIVIDRFEDLPEALERLPAGA